MWQVEDAEPSITTCVWTGCVDKDVIIAELVAALDGFPVPPIGSASMLPEEWDVKLQDYWEEVVDWDTHKRQPALWSALQIDRG